MPLNLLPLDPTPKDSELRLDDGYPLPIARVFAKFHWRDETKKRDRNAFPVHFASDVSDRDYIAYLESPLWKRIGSQVLKAAGYQCAGCFAKATQVHHRDYRPRILDGDDTSALVALCGACHDKVHNDEMGKKRASWNECERVLAEIVAAHDAVLQNSN